MGGVRGTQPGVFVGTIIIIHRVISFFASKRWSFVCRRYEKHVVDVVGSDPVSYFPSDVFCRNS